MTDAIYTGDVIPNSDLSALDTNIFAPGTYGTGGGLTESNLLGSVTNSASPIVGQTILPTTSSGDIGNPAGDYVPQATNPVTQTNPTSTTGAATTPVPSSSCSWSVFGICLTRIFIVVLGIIFIAVGLTMFKTTADGDRSGGESGESGGESGESGEGNDSRSK